MKTLFFLLLTLLLLLTSSCNDNSDLVQRIDSLEDRVDNLEEICININSEIKTLKTLIDAQSNQDYITNIETIYNGNEITGYKIYFKKTEPIEIRNGEDGKNGVSPIISIKKDTDGLYYWTMNNEWLLDENNNKVLASASNGNNGTTPKFKIENEYWYISYDNGKTWTQLGKATGNDGEDGDSFFQSVDTSNPDHITFTLSDGTEIYIPRYTESMSIDFDQYDNIYCESGSTIKLNFTIKNGGNSPQIEALGENGWSATVSLTNNEKGYLSVTAPSPYTNGKIIVIATDGKNQIVMRTLKFANNILKITDSNEFEVPRDGGNISFNILTNQDYTIEIPQEASWIQKISTRNTRNETITLAIDRNDGQDSRNATITIKGKNGGIEYITVLQIGDTFYSYGEGTEESPYIINSVSEYIKMAKYVNNGNSLKGKYIKINSPLDFNNQTYIPIGNIDNPFSGNISAKNNTLSNITISGNEYLGVFGYTYDAKISDIDVSIIKIDGKMYLGGIVGKAERTYISNIYMKECNIINGNHIGGICGEVYSCEIDRCLVYGKLGKTSTSHIGGVSGYTINSNITNCQNESTISGYDCVGGIVGYQAEGSSIKNCSNTSQFQQSEIIGSLGGIVGYNCGDIINCVMSNSINATSVIGGTSFTKMTTGGICGYNHDPGYIYNSYFIKIYPINSEINLCGELNWGQCINSGSFDEAGNYNGYSILNILNSWVNSQTNSEYCEWNSTYPKLGL